MKTISELNPKIFVVEDDPFYQDFLNMHFKRAGFTNVHMFTSGEEMIQQLRLEESPFLCILDYRIEGGMNGNQVLNKVKKVLPYLPVIILSAQETLSVAVQALRLGAYDYVLKDEYAFERIEHLLEKISRLQKLEKEERQFKRMKVYFSLSITTIVALLIALNHYFGL